MRNWFSKEHYDFIKKKKTYSFPCTSERFLHNFITVVHCIFNFRNIQHLHFSYLIPSMFWLKTQKNSLCFTLLSIQLPTFTTSVVQFHQLPPFKLEIDLRFGLFAVFYFLHCIVSLTLSTSTASMGHQIDPARNACLRLDTPASFTHWRLSSC